MVDKDKMDNILHNNKEYKLVFDKDENCNDGQCSLYDGNCHGISCNGYYLKEVNKTMTLDEFKIEAEHRGYKEGVEVISLIDDNTYTLVFHEAKISSIREDYYSYRGVGIYNIKTKEWAKIVNESWEDIIKYRKPTLDEFKTEAIKRGYSKGASINSIVPYTLRWDRYENIDDTYSIDGFAIYNYKRDTLASLTKDALKGGILDNSSFVDNAWYKSSDDGNITYRDINGNYVVDDKDYISIFNKPSTSTESYPIPTKYENHGRLIYPRLGASDNSVLYGNIKSVKTYDRMSDEDMIKYTKPKAKLINRNEDKIPLKTRTKGSSNNKLINR